MNTPDITLSDWIKSFPEQQVRERLEELGARRNAITEEMEGLQEWLDLYTRINPSTNGEAATVIPQVVSPTRRRKYPPKGKAAIAFLSRTPGVEKSFADIREALIAADEMGPEDNEKHALRVALYKAHHAQKIERPRDGWFRVPRPAETLPTAQAVLEVR